MFSLIVYFLNKDKQERIDEVLNDKLTFLDLTYKQALDRFEVIANNIYMSFQNDQELVNLLANCTTQNIDTTHQKMYEHLKDEFERLKQLEILGIQFVTPKNISVLRLHEPQRYKDDLSDSRYSIGYVNQYKTKLYGFEEGKSSHAFRMVYPLFSNGNYIGVMEVLFSSTILQNYSMRVSGIHTHFIVNRNVFKTNEWKSRVLEPYEQSIEHKDFMFSMSDHIKHPRLEHSRLTLIEPLKKQIDRGITQKKEFAVYKNEDENVGVVAFLPIKRFKDDETVAYLVSYTESKKILSILYDFKILVFLLVVIFTLGYLIVYRFLLQKEKIENELHYDVLTHAYNRKFLNKNIASIIKSLNKELLLGVVMVDIDFFKKVNDTYGHNIGDIVLKQFAAYINSSIRSEDLLIRWGGEEFIILIKTKSNKTLLRTAEHIRQRIEFESFDTVEKLTCSIGITLYIQNEDIETTIQRADKALYLSKENGRNRVTLL